MTIFGSFTENSPHKISAYEAQPLPTLLLRWQKNGAGPRARDTEEKAFEKHRYRQMYAGANMGHPCDAVWKRSSPGSVTKPNFALLNGVWRRTQIKGPSRREALYTKIRNGATG